MLLRFSPTSNALYEVFTNIKVELFGLKVKFEDDF